MTHSCHLGKTPVSVLHHCGLVVIKREQSQPLRLKQLFEANFAPRGHLATSRDIFWRRKWQPTPVFLPGKSRGGRKLIGYSPWGRKKSDTTERLHFRDIFGCDNLRGGGVLLLNILHCSKPPTTELSCSKYQESLGC